MERHRTEACEKYKIQQQRASASARTIAAAVNNKSKSKDRRNNIPEDNDDDLPEKLPKLDDNNNNTSFSYFKPGFYVERDSEEIANESSQSITIYSSNENDSSSMEQKSLDAA